MNSATPSCGNFTRFSRTAKGFTLIELMIVVVIIGILAAIAYPSYQDQVRKTKRTDGRGVLTDLANLQEKYYNQCYTYSNTLGGTFPVSGGDTCTSGSPGLGRTTTSPENLYDLVITAASANGYTMEARAKAGTSQASDTGCLTLTISSTGAKGPSGCW